MLFHLCYTFGIIITSIYKCNISGLERLIYPELDSMPASWDASFLPDAQAGILNHLIALADEALGD